MISSYVDSNMVAIVVAVVIAVVIAVVVVVIIIRNDDDYSLVGMTEGIVSFVNTV